MKLGDGKYEELYQFLGCEWSKFRKKWAAAADNVAMYQSFIHNFVH